MSQDDVTSLDEYRRKKAEPPSRRFIPKWVPEWLGTCSLLTCTVTGGHSVLLSTEDHALPLDSARDYARFILVSCIRGACRGCNGTDGWCAAHQDFDALLGQIDRALRPLFVAETFNAPSP